MTGTQTKTILLVEDDFLNRRLSKKILTRVGYRILETKNILEAVYAIDREAIDLAIIDIHLGNEAQGGITLGDQLNSRYSIPFIYLTAYESPEIVDKAISTSPYSYLTKPFKDIDLITSVDIALRRTAVLQKHRPFITVKDGEYTVELPIDQVNYITSSGNYLMIHTDTKMFKCRSTIKEIINQLPRSQFVQTHRAYIVNKTKIEKYNNRNIWLRGVELPLSHTFLENLSK